MVQDGQIAENNEAEWLLIDWFIDFVQENPYIYEKFHPDHFRSYMRNEVWYHIAGVCSIPGNFSF